MDDATLPEASEVSPRDVGQKVIERPSPLTGLAHSGIVLVAAGVMFFREISESGLANIGTFGLFAGIGTAIVVVIAGITGVLAWRTTTFIADDDEFRIERRLIWASSSRIDYTKVQSVDVTQPFVARLLGLAKVQIDVGGAGGQSLAFLTKARAEALREHILARAHVAKLGPAAQQSAIQSGVPFEPGSAGNVPAGSAAPDFMPGPEQGFPGSPHLSPAPNAPEEPVHAVSIPTLLLGTFLSSTSLVFVVMAAVILAITLIFDSSPAVFGLLVGAVAWVWNQLGTNWNFRMTRRDGALRISRGLTSTTAQGLRPERIQGVVIEQDLLQRLTGLYRMQASVLGYNDPTAEDGGNKKSVILPFGSWADVETVLRAIWPDTDLRQIQPTPQPNRARWLTPINWWTHTWGVGPDVLVARHGLFENRLTVVPHRRMQSIGVTQGPLQRLLKLATVEIHTTDGPVSLKLYHVDERVAREIFDAQIIRGREARAAAA